MATWVRSGAAVTVGLVLAAALTASTASAQPDPLCRVSTEPGYGYTKDRPVQVGGSPMYGAARQRRYLSALRGPKGETLSIERGGSTPGADPDTMLDIYSVTYDGLEKPITLYLDWYNYTAMPPRPAGDTSGVLMVSFVEP